MTVSQLPTADTPGVRSRSANLVIALYILWPWRWRWLTHCFLRATAGTGEPPAGPTEAEAMVESTGVAGAHRIMRRAARALGTLADRAHRRTVAADEARVQANWIPERPVTEPHGGLVPVAVAVAEQARLQERIGRETERGSRRHRRVSRGQRRTARVLPVIDLLVLTWFVAGVVNIDWSAPDPVLLAVAVALALLATVAAAAYGDATGNRLRQFKTDAGELAWGQLGLVTGTMLAGAAVMIALLGLLMAVRVHVETVQATGTGGLLPLTLAAVLGVTTVVANFFIVFTGFADGSTETDRLDVLHAAVGPHVAERVRLLERADVLDRKAELDRARLERARSRVVAAASEPVYAAHQAILLARAVRSGDRAGRERLDPNRRGGPAGFLAEPGCLIPDERVLDVQAIGQEQAERAAPPARSWYPMPHLAVSPEPRTGRPDEAA